VIIGLEALHREWLPLEIREEQGGGHTGKTKLSAPCKVPAERLGRPNLYWGVAALSDHVDGLLDHHVTNAQRTQSLGRHASRSEVPQEMGLPIGKSFLEKERSQGSEAATALAGERL
jgi:hypothetical protein